MHRFLLAIALAIGLALTSGCFSRSTEPVYKSKGGSSADRSKMMKEVVFPKTKGKSPLSKTDAGAAKGNTGTGCKAKNLD